MRSMLTHGSPRVASEGWTGHWGADARYYARRSDGLCFAIDGAVSVLDLTAATPPSPDAHPVASLPVSGRYTLSVLALRGAAPATATANVDGAEPMAAGDAQGVRPRLLAYGVRRRT